MFRMFKIWQPSWPLFIRDIQFYLDMFHAQNKFLGYPLQAYQFHNNNYIFLDDSQ